MAKKDYYEALGVGKNAKACQVPALEVGRYYLKCEFNHIFQTPELKEAVANKIDQMPESEIWVLLDALSISYRLNSVFWLVANQDFIWTKEVVPVEQIRLTGMGGSINDLIHSDNIRQDPLKLKNYLQKYYQEYKNDPKKYGVKPENQVTTYPAILLYENNNKLDLLDGSHRFIEQLLSNKKQVTAYVARSKTKSYGIRPVLGRGFTRNLVRVYKYDTDPRGRDQLRQATEVLSNYIKDDNPLDYFTAIDKESEQRNG